MYWYAAFTLSLTSTCLYSIRATRLTRIYITRTQQNTHSMRSDSSLGLQLTCDIYAGPPSSTVGAETELWSVVITSGTTQTECCKTNVLCIIMHYDVSTLIIFLHLPHERSLSTIIKDVV